MTNLHIKNLWREQIKYCLEELATLKEAGKLTDREERALAIELNELLREYQANGEDK